MENKNTQKPNRGEPVWSAWSLAWELGYTIAVPIIVFALLGRFLDTKLHTGPWILLLGIILSMIISTVGIYRKTRNILQSFNDKNGASKDQSPPV